MELNISRNDCASARFARIAVSLLATLTLALPTAALAATALYRINAGGPAFVDSDGNSWSTDNFSNTGIAVDFGYIAIANTTKPALYQTARRDDSNAPQTQYNLPVPNGTYQVRLHFAENLFSGSGNRRFSVLAEDSTVISNLDVYAQAGGANTALMKTFNVTVADGSLTLLFQHGGADNPTVSGIEVLALHGANASDFDGDGKSDILWRNTSTGAVSIWLIDGLTAHGTGGPGFGSVSSDWAIAGVGDFDGDGKSDILWRQSSTGAVALWLINSGTIKSGPGLGTVSSDWTIAGAGDFDGDGNSDILWRQTSTGTVAIWEMNGGTIKSGPGLGTVFSDWGIAGTGDFDGDGMSDILWRQTSTGAVALWLMNGGTIKSGPGLGAVSADWAIAGVGDFDGDGKSDILWRQASTGAVAVWLMSGGAIKSGPGLGAVAADWTIAGVGDFDGDGKSDILWRQTSTGTVALWLMNGGTVKSGPGLGTVSADWQTLGQLLAGGNVDTNPPPTALSYPSPQNLTIGVAIGIVSPTVTGTVSNYAVTPALPAGVTLSASTGQLSGTPAATSAQAVYTVTASNTSGSTSFQLTLAVQAPQAQGTVTTYNVGFQVITYENGVKAGIWYPTLDPPGYDTYPDSLSSNFVRNAAQVTGQSFPLIIYSHGDLNCAQQTAFVNEALARNGFVVAAPDHPDAMCSVDGGPIRGPDPVPKPAYTSPGQWNDTIGAQRRADLRALVDHVLATDPFRSHVNAQKIGLAGYSWGGYAALGLVGGWPGWLDRRFGAALLMAPYTAPYLQYGNLSGVNVPLMYQVGDGDFLMTPYVVGPASPYSIGAYDAANAPKYLLQFQGMDHFSWTMLRCPYPGTISQCLQAIPSMAVMANYAVAFFQRHLNGIDQPALHTWDPALNSFRYAPP